MKLSNYVSPLQYLLIAFFTFSYQNDGIKIFSPTVWKSNEEVSLS